MFSDCANTMGGGGFTLIMCMVHGTVIQLLKRSSALSTRSSTVCSAGGETAPEAQSQVALLQDPHAVPADEGQRGAEWEQCWPW